MMQINLFNITYLFIRLAPFILVCYFTLGSIFNQDLKGIIYLIGLLFACFITAGLGNIPIFTKVKNLRDLPQLCKSISLSKDGTPISNVPFGITILSYTFFYLFYIIAKNGLWANNAPTFILFPILIVCDFIWNLQNGCGSMEGLFMSFGVGAIIGTIWATIISASGSTELQFFNGLSNKETCSRPSKSVFKCTYVKKNK
jgi:hypothetical protein